MLDNPIIIQIERHGTLDTKEQVLHCDCCDEEIYEGESYWKIRGITYCAECIKEMEEIA